MVVWDSAGRVCVARYRPKG